MPRPPAPPGSAAHYAEGTVARDFTDKDSGLRGLVIRGGYSWCGYVGVPTPHPLFGLEELQFECHWGITFRGQGDGVLRPASFYWWGWDYSHAGDSVCWPPEFLEMADAAGFQLPGGKHWLLDEVVEDVLDVLMHLRQALASNSRLSRELLLRTMPD